MKKGIQAAVLAFVLMPFVSQAEIGVLRAVQLDLARQKETVGFVKAYLARMAQAGYNTMVLYLEDRVKTASYPYPSDAESYSPDEIREIVAEGTRLGLDLVPVVSPLGHTERFLAHAEMAAFGEQCEGVGRWGRTDNPGCFCLENPAAKKWMETYISDVASLFPGENIHLGFDETWSLGYCTRCRPIVEKEGLAALYLRHVLWANGLAKRLGKRMWMWDDFFEFFPSEIVRVPRDIVLCCWNYDSNIERTGPRAHFGGRLRRDNLKIYKELGIRAIVCPWLSCENVRTMTEYAQTHACDGFLYTQWEMGTDFHAFIFPRVLAAASLWNGTADFVSGAWLAQAVETCYPTLDAEARKLVEGLLFDQSLLKYTTVTLPNILNGVHETSRLRYWKTAIAALRRHSSAPGVGPVPPDPLSEAAFLDDLTVRTEMVLLCEETRNAARYLYLPERTSAQSVSARKELVRIRARWPELVARRDEQWKAWRPGLLSEKEKQYRAHLPAVIDAALAQKNVADGDEWVLEVNLAMIDTHGAPTCSVEGRTKGGAWQPIAAGNWKPDVTDPPYVAKTVPVRLKAAPAELRLSCKGYGAATLCHLSLRNAHQRLVPSGILSVQGEVRDAESLLTDDFSDCRIGLSDCTQTFLHPTRAEVVSSVEMSVADR